MKMNKKMYQAKWQMTMIFTLATFALFGQSQTPEQQSAPLGFLSKNLVVPPSPEAATLGQYGNVPVNLYTGRTNISIPLYELKGKELQLPITMSYNSGGFKVEELPGWTGLGWTLNAGGVITRSALGRPDECFNFFNKASEVYQNIANLDAIQQQDFYKKFSDGLLEGEPDIYFYNFASNSGKFFIDAYQNIILEDYKPVSLSLSNICVDESVFNAKGADGTTYIFSDREITDLIYDDESLTSGQDHYTFTSSWYLTKMISANGADTVFFEYDYQSPLPTLTNPIYGQHISSTVHGPTSSDGSGETPPCGNIQYSESASAATTISRQYLASIRFRDVVIDFNSTSSGSSLGGRKLNSIIISEKGAQVKKYIFEYSYFGNSSTNYTDRLRLDKLFEYGPSDQVSPPYKFDYSTNHLPDFFSKSVDHWGYYNNSGSEILPTIDNGNCDLGMGANREPSETGVAACILTKMTYPTGGYTTFEYGIHQKGTVPSLQTVNVEVDHGTQNLLGGGTITSGTCQGYKKYKIVDVTVPSNVYRVEIGVPGLVWDEQTHGEGAIAFAGLIPSAAYTNTSCDVFAWVSSHLSLFDYYWFLEPIGAPMTPPTILDPGSYKLVVVNEFSFEYISFGINCITLEQQEVVNAPPDEFVGGARIESITDYTSSGNVASVREYNYQGSPVNLQGNDYYYQSGLSFGDPTYAYNTSHFEKAPFSQMQGPFSIDYTSSTLHVVASSRTALGTMLGSHVGYSRVTENFLGPSAESNGSKVYEYRNIPIPAQGYPFNHGLDEYGQGDLLSEKVYDKNGTLVSETLNEYAFDESESRNGGTVHGVKVYPSSTQGNQLKLIQTVGGEFIWVADFDMSYYLTQGGWFPTPYYSKNYKVRNSITSYSCKAHWQYLSRTTKKEYRNGELFSSYTKNYYDNAVHAQITRIERENSEGETYLSRLRYPGDAVTGLDAGASAAMSSLVSRHVYDKVLEKIDYDPASNVHTAQKVHYAQVSGKPFPKDVYFANITTPVAESALATAYEKRATYQYNSSGDLLDYSKELDVNQCFVWSSDHQYLIAEVNGALSTDVAYTGFEDGSSEGGWSFSLNTASSAKTGAKSHSLSGASVTRSGLNSSQQYELSFWAKDGTPSVTGVSSSEDDPNADAQGWKFFKKIIAGVTSVTISATGSEKIDELRLHPLGAQMTTYVYDPGYGVRASVDPNGRQTVFEYYPTGRLKQIKDFDGNILKTFQYHYQTQP